MTDRPLRAAVIGAGLLGVDLVDRLAESSMLSCTLVVGRADNAGIRAVARPGIRTAIGGVGVVAGTDIDVVFDASTAKAHATHRGDLVRAGMTVVNLTPGCGGTAIDRCWTAVVQTGVLAAIVRLLYGRTRA